MKKLLVALVMSLLGNQVFALSVNVTDFNFDYNNPHGQGSASNFSRSSKMIDGGVEVIVDRIDHNFKFSISGAENQEFELKNAPSMMTNADSMQVRGFNLNVGDQIDLSLTSARFNSKKDTLKLDGLTMNCLRNVDSKDVMDQLILGCIQKLTFKANKYSSQEVLKAIESILLETSDLVSKSNLSVSSVSFKANSGKFELSADVKAQVSGKVTSKGSLGYDIDKGILAIKISEVKLSILNITSKVFDELRKNESEKFKVKEPYIYITVK